MTGQGVPSERRRAGLGRAMTTVEFGVRYEGRSESFTAGGYTEKGARNMVEFAGPDWDPRPVEVMVREVGEWRAVS